MVAAAIRGADREYASTLGADEVVDYEAAPFEEALSPLDLILDVIGGEIQERSVKALGRGGILVSTVGIHVAGQATSRGIETRDFQVRSDG